MAAFQFPAAPFDLETVQNPITGSTYQWRNDFSKWVLTRESQTAVGDIIWEGDNPPDPIGDYKLWYSTDTLELYFHYCDVNGVCAWLPTSVPITMLEDLDNTVFDLGVLLNQVNQAASTNENEIQTIKDGLGQVDLQEVLDNGNIADKGAEFGGAVIIKAEETAGDGDPLFAIEGDQANDGTGVNLLVARHHEAQGDQVRYYGPVVNNKEVTTKEYVDTNTDLDSVLSKGNTSSQEATLGGLNNNGNALFKFGTGQGVVLDSGSSFEPMLELRSYSGPNERKSVLSVNARGNAELLGHLTLSPGTSGNQAVTYNQLLEIAEEIESIIPSIERGQFEFTLNEITTSSNGKYNLLRAFTEDESKAMNAVCMADYTDCIFSEFPEDCQQKLEACVSLIPEIGDSVADDEFAIATHIRFSKKDIEGTQHAWNDVKVGQLIDVFNQDDDGYMVAEITEITKDGNGITTFSFDVIQSKGKASGNCRIKIFEVNFDNTDIGDFVRKSGDTMTGPLVVAPSRGSSPSVELKPAPDAPDARAVIYTRDLNNQISFLVSAGGSPRAGRDGHPFMAVEERDLTTKKYVDDAIAYATAGSYGVPYKYRGEDKRAEDLQPGEFFISSNQSLYAHHIDALGRDVMFTEDNFYPHRAFKGLLKVYYPNGDIKHALEFSEIITGNSNNNYVKWVNNWVHKDASLWASGTIYYLADGFILPC